MKFKHWFVFPDFDNASPEKLSSKLVVKTRKKNKVERRNMVKSDRWGSLITEVKKAQ